MKKTAIIIITVLICALAASGIYFAVLQKPKTGISGSTIEKSFPQNNTRQATAINNYANFISAARAVTPAVVHIKTTYDRPSRSGNPFGNYNGPTVALGSASGVTLSADGYIATNNHVVEDATKIEVIFPDRHEFTATLVGTDPNTDLALIKINATGLPFIKLGNSDNVEVGEWVLAIGYPFSLNTTVTAGIISAKGRSIGIVNRARNEASSIARQTTGIESFLQTDAAINPGNSGGALVNTSGELVGINTAIASMTGSYAGYAFAIPVNLAKKILDDLREFGTVKRGILGVSFPAPSSEDQYMQQHDIDPGSVKGVFITGIQPNSAAAKAGLKEGDIIQSIDGVEIFSSPEFSERIARHRPGDKVTLLYLRDGKRDEVSVVLKAEEPDESLSGNAESLKEIYRKLGAKFSPLTPALKQRFNLDAGVVVTEVLTGGFFDQVGIPPGTIIAYINGKTIYNANDIDEALLSARNGRILILGIAPDGSRIAFNFSLGT